MEIIFPLNLIVERDWWQVLLLTLFICPGLPFVLEYVQYRRLIPINRHQQFAAFWPGNFFLAGFVTLSSVGLQHIKATGWWSHEWFSGAVFMAAFVVYASLNVLDLKSHYTKAQLASWFKTYHNSLYCWYAYVAVMTYVGLLASALPWWYKLTATAVGAVWVGCMVLDNTASADVVEQRMRHAHSPVNLV